MAGRKQKKEHSYFPVLIEKQERGYWAMCPSIRGCHTTGPGYEEALANIKARIQRDVQDLLE